MFPEPRGHEFECEPHVGELLPHRLGLAADLAGGEGLEVGHGVVVVELDPLEAERDGRLEHVVKRHLQPDGGGRRGRRPGRCSTAQWRSVTK